MTFASTVECHVSCEEYTKDIVHSALSSPASQVNVVLCTSQIHLPYKLHKLDSNFRLSVGTLSLNVHKSCLLTYCKHDYLQNYKL